MAKYCLQRGILLPLLCCLIVYQVREGMADIHWGMCYSHQRKILKFCLTASSGGYEYGTLWCGKTQLSIHPQKFGTWISILGNQVTQTKSVSRTLHFVQCMGLICMSVRAAKKD